MDLMYVSFALLFLLCLAIRSGYEHLKDAGRLNPENKLIFASIFAAMCALWASWFILCPLDPLQIEIPRVVRWSGFALFGAGMILAIGALIQLKGLENIDHLVTDGFFSKIRHPMYTGFILWILGWAIYHSAFASLLVGLVGIANIVHWRQLEESRLQIRYGDTYQNYSRTTWF